MGLGICLLAHFLRHPPAGSRNARALPVESAVPPAPVPAARSSVPADGPTPGAGGDHAGEPPAAGAPRMIDEMVDPGGVPVRHAAHRLLLKFPRSMDAAGIDVVLARHGIEREVQRPELARLGYVVARVVSGQRPRQVLDGLTRAGIAGLRAEPDFEVTALAEPSAGMPIPGTWRRADSTARGRSIRNATAWWSR